MQNRGLKFKNIIHDRNHQVLNLIERVVDNDQTDIEQNDIWHVIKSDMKKFSELGKELKKNENITWSSQLSDKYQGVKNPYIIQSCTVVMKLIH